jgi:hypothetical protein
MINETTNGSRSPRIKVQIKATDGNNQSSKCFTVVIRLCALYHLPHASGAKNRVRMKK